MNSAVITGRVWRLALVAPCPWLTSNTLNGPADIPIRSRRVAKWRKTMCDCCGGSEPLPTGGQRLDYIRVQMVARFLGRPPVRDGNAGNLDPTKKAVLDGLGPARTRKVNGTVRTYPGWGLIPDDSDKHIESAVITIGAPLPSTVMPGHPGLLVVTITELLRADALF